MGCKESTGASSVTIGSHINQSSASEGMDMEIHNLLNEIRANPKMLIPELFERLSLYEGTIMHAKDGRDLQTIEGTPVVLETIDYLNHV